MQYALQGRGKWNAFFVCTLHIAHKYSSTSTFYSHFLSAFFSNNKMNFFLKGMVVNAHKGCRWRTEMVVTPDRVRGHGELHLKANKKCKIKLHEISLDNYKLNLAFLYEHPKTKQKYSELPRTRAVNLESEKQWTTG